MARLVEVVVASARDRHSAFDARRQPTGPVYRFLADYVGELQELIADLATEGTAVETTIDTTLPLADFAAGIALGPHRHVTEVVAVDPSTRTPQRTYPVELISSEARLAPNTPPMSAWVTGNTLFLNGTPNRWSFLGSISVTIVPQFGDADAAALQVPRAILPLPDSAARAVIENLALFMAKRTDPSIKIDIGAFEREAAKAETRFTDELISRMQDSSFPTLDVYRP